MATMFVVGNRVEVKQHKLSMDVLSDKTDSLMHKAALASGQGWRAVTLEQHVPSWQQFGVTHEKVVTNATCPS